jgi:hypothetical protein
VNCFTSNQCSEWLKQRGIAEAPYGVKVPRGTHYLQFAPPKSDECDAFVASILAALGPFSGALLQLTDWIYDPEYEADPTAALRLMHGERRSLIDVPGFLFDPNEMPEAIGLGSLVLKRGWTGYIYLESKAATLLLWDGDLIDFWSKEKGIAEQLRATLLQSKARVVHGHVR